MLENVFLIDSPVMHTPGSHIDPHKVILLRKLDQEKKFVEEEKYSHFYVF